MFNIYDAKAKLSRLIAQVERTGRPITICRNGEPIADLVPHRKRADPMRPNAELRGAVFHGDPTAPVDEKDWPAAAR